MLADTFSSRRGPLTSSQSQATTLSSSLLSAARKRIEYCICFRNDRPPFSKPFYLRRPRHSRLPSMTVELVGKEISWNLGETTATGGLFTRGSVGAGGEKTAQVNSLGCLCLRPRTKSKARLAGVTGTAVRGRPAASASTSSSQCEARPWADNCIFSLTAREQYPASDVSHNLPRKYYRIEAEIRCNTCN